MCDSTKLKMAELKFYQEWNKKEDNREIYEDKFYEEFVYPFMCNSNGPHIYIPYYDYSLKDWALKEVQKEIVKLLDLSLTYEDTPEAIVKYKGTFIKLFSRELRTPKLCLTACQSSGKAVKHLELVHLNSSFIF